MTTDTNAIYASGYLLWMRGTTLMAQPFDPKKLKLTGEAAPVADPVGKSAITGRMNVAASSNGLLLYSASGSNQLTWLDATGKPSGTLGEPNDYVIFRISPDGRRVAAAIGNPTRADLWLLDVERNVSSRFTFTGRGHSDPVWSPDGRTIVYRWRGCDFSQGLQRRWRGTARHAIGHSSIPHGLVARRADDPVQPILSRDRNRSLGSSRDIRKATPLVSRRRTCTRNSVNRTASFRPKRIRGGWPTRPTNPGQYEVYVQAFPEARGKFQISSGGGRFPKWGPPAGRTFASCFTCRRTTS